VLVIKGAAHIICLIVNVSVLRIANMILNGMNTLKQHMTKDHTTIHIVF
jgi:hypothetical protein